jgi:hypothetical protein
VPQRVLRRMGCGPVRQRLDGRVAQGAHLRTSSPSVDAGSR